MTTLFFLFYHFSFFAFTFFVSSKICISPVANIKMDYSENRKDGFASIWGGC